MDFNSDYTMDVFNEQLVKIKNGIGVTLLKIAIILFAVAFTVLVPLFFIDQMYVMGFYGYVVLTIWVCIFVFWKRFHREYEYIFTNGVLDIDKVYAKRSRKRIVSIDLENVEVIAPVNASCFTEDMKRLGNADQYDCTANDASAFTCYLIAVTKQGKVCIMFDPNKKMLKAMRQIKPSLFAKFEF
ncbi:MAG: hypothetical protein II982_00120 [Clostridia bacterium]|nr:hypothetical protein [Clostridia bacterium]